MTPDDFDPHAARRSLIGAGLLLVGVVLVLEAFDGAFAPGYAGAVLVLAGGWRLFTPTRTSAHRRLSRRRRRRRR